MGALAGVSLRFHAARRARGLLGLGALLACLASSGCGSTSSDPSSSTTPDADSFAVLRGPATRSVPLPIAKRLKLKDAELHQAHLVKTSRYSAWVIPVPSAHSVCIVLRSAIVAGGAGSCIPEADARFGALFTGRNFFTGRWWIAGIAPDNVSRVRVSIAGGRAQSFSFASNTLVASLTGRMTGATYLSGGGTRVSIQR